MWLTPHPVPLPQGERGRPLNGLGLLPLPSAGEGWGEGVFVVTSGNIGVIKSRKRRRRYPGSLRAPAPLTIPDTAQAPFRDDDLEAFDRVRYQPRLRTGATVICRTGAGGRSSVVTMRASQAKTLYSSSTRRLAS